MTRIEQQARFYASIPDEDARETMDPGEWGLRQYAILALKMAEALEKIAKGNAGTWTPELTAKNALADTGWHADS